MGHFKSSAAKPLVMRPYENYNLRPGLSFHFGAQHEQHDCTWFASIDAGLRLFIVLEGRLSLHFGPHHLELDNRDNAKVCAAAVYLNQADQFTRNSHLNCYTKRITIGFSAAWLDHSGLALNDYLPHLAHCHWPLSDHAIAIVNQMIDPPAISADLTGLYIESRAIELLLEGLSYLKRNNHNEAMHRTLSSDSYLKMQQVKRWVFENLATPLTNDLIAAKFHLSKTTLQRHFKLAFGVTISDFVVQAKLEMAYEMLKNGQGNVSKASEVAGYSTPNSFSTAFKRYFGVSPKSVKKKV
ncbi:AraC family transcriptional regulator [Pseudoalteromonas spongiae]|uniref:AraC family transcriptional regulator n=1 Tax=Pseudoalteromonas spongiae TaxID=298657 RepID=A0ABU8EV67_9GAMM